MLPQRRDRFLQALGMLLMALGGCSVIAAILIGPIAFGSLDEALAAHLPQRAIVAFAGIVAAILGWVLRGSGTPG